MAKFYGTIGFASDKETSPGAWTEEVIERPYTGDVVQASRRWTPTDEVNPDLTISDTISIVADEFCITNMHFMKYVRWRNAAWAINSVTIQRPRIIVMMGGLYNGNKTPTPV